MENNRKKIVFLYCLFTLVGLFLFANHRKVYAQEEVSPKFSVNAIMPENQKENISGYFHINMVEKSQQNLMMEISNNTDEALTVLSTLTTATTNSNGVINYKEADTPYDDSLVILFEEISKLSDSIIELQPLETKKLEVAINLPATEFEGQILGGISFEEEIAEDVDESSLMIINRFSYNIAVMIELGNTLPENELNLKTVAASQRAGYNFIEANLQNVAPRFISSMAVEASIYKKNHQEPTYTSTRTGLKMAPNSNFNFGIDLNQTKFETGEYLLYMKITADDQFYEFEKLFEISNEEAKTLNKSAVVAQTSDTKKLPIIIVLGFILNVLIILIYIIVKRRKLYEKKNK